MRLSEFVDLYVRLRHPHHYDPSSWPAGLWLTFLLPIALAIPAHRIAVREDPSGERRRAAEVFTLFIAILIVALVGAGLWYVSEPLIQMSLYRFSIFPKLLSCIAAAWLIWRSCWGRIVLRMLVACLLFGVMFLILGGNRFEDLPNFLTRNAFALWLFALVALVALLRPRVVGWGGPFLSSIVGICVIVGLALSWPKLGILHEGSRGDDIAYLTLCDWVNQHTPRDAVFLVPPDEQSFRLHARRAIVVNFKNVPQLSGELGEWRDRLQNVLVIADIRSLPRPFYRTLHAIRARYATLPPEHLIAAAQRYGARYVVTVRPLHAPGFGQPAFSDKQGQYFLYDLNAP
jgi:hypothetical protein